MQKLVQARAALFAVLEPLWERRLPAPPRADASAADMIATLSTKRSLDFYGATLSKPALAWLRLAEECAVQPRRLLLTFICIVILSVAGCGLWIFMQMDRDVLLSRIAKTQAGRLTLDRAFLGRVLTWVVLPIVGVAMAQYPDAAHTVFSWAGPFAKALH